MNPVIREYQAAYGRVPDAAGAAYWVGEIAAGRQSLSTLATTFSNSSEFLARFGATATTTANSALVSSLYSQVYGRVPDSAGLTYWVGTGLTAAQLLNAFANANEFVNGTNAAVSAYQTASIAGTAPTTGSLFNLGGTIAGGTTYALTTGVDTITGTVYNDTINGVINDSSSTLTALDTIDGGDGKDTLTISVLTDIPVIDSSFPAGLTVKNVETVNVAAALGVRFDTSSFTGATNVNVTKSNGTVDVTAGAGQAVSVTDTAGVVTVAGGSTQSITTVGDVGLSLATGAVTANVTDGTIGIDDGTSVSITSTITTSGRIITVGGGTHPTGDVTINQTVTGGAALSPGYIYVRDGSATTGGAVTITQTLTGTDTLTGDAFDIGGGTVDVITVNATQATLDGVAVTTIGDVYVTGTAKTTSVTVNQTAAATAVAKVDAVAGVTETSSAVFTALTSGQTLIVGGLTFTAGAAGTTAAQTAAAFANLFAGTTQGNSTLGTYTGTFSGWTTGAVTGTSTVLFTSTTANNNVTDLAFTGTGTAPTLTKTEGSSATAAVAGVGGIVDGAVVVTDVNYNTSTAGTIASVALSGYASGSSISSDALTTLSLANVNNATLSVSNHTSTSLALTVNNVTGTSSLNLDAAGAKYTALNVTTAAKDSALNITGAAVTALTVAGSNALNLSSSTFSALKTVTVSGAAGVTLDASGSTVTDVNASASSGKNTFKVDGSKATYEGGSGVDALTLSSSTVSKAITLGDGNDTVTLASGTTAVTGSISGGDGTDTLTMVAADAVTASADTTFASKVTGFEVLALTGGTGAQTVHIDTLGSFNAVTTGGEATGGVLTMDGFTSGGTLTLTSSATGTGAYVVSSSAWATPTTDTFNIALTKAGAVSAGSVTAANVESLAISATDTTSGVKAGATADSLTLVATKATALTVTGNTTLTLTVSGDTALTSVDASGMTGGLVLTTAGTVAETVKGGATANTLTAHSGTVGDTLIGGASADLLTSNAGLTTLTGGAGNDVFVVATVGGNVNTYTTVTDASSGDRIILSHKTTSDSFTTTKVALSDTAVFQDYANAVVNAGGNASTNAKGGWFQYNGNTYIVESLHDASTTADFQNGTDLVVKLTGLVDLSKASFNATYSELLIA